MHIRIIAALVLGLIVSPLSYAQNDTNYTGEVRKFKKGKVMEVDIGDKRSKVYDLASKDTTYVIAPGLKRGSKVTIAETKDAQDHKVVSVAPR